MKKNNILVVLLIISLVGCDRIRNVRRKVRSFVLSPFRSNSPDPVKKSTQDDETVSEEQDQNDKAALVLASKDRVEGLSQAVLTDNWKKTLELCRAYNNDPLDSNIKELFVSTLELALQDTKIVPDNHQDTFSNCILGLAGSLEMATQENLSILKTFISSIQGDNRTFLLKIISDVWIKDSKYFFENYSDVFEYKECNWILYFLDDEITEEGKLTVWRQRYEALKELERPLYPKVLIHSFLKKCIGTLEGKIRILDAKLVSPEVPSNASQDNLDEGGQNEKTPE